MKPRRWVLVVAAALVLLGGLATWGLRQLERHLGLERIVVERIRPAIGGSFDVGRVRFGFLSVYLSDVSASLPLDIFQLDIQDIQVGFSIRRLIQTGGDFGASINTVVLLHPRLTIRLQPNASGVETPEGRGPNLTLPVGRLPIAHLEIRKGTVRIIGQTGEEFVFGQFLDGHITDESAGIEFELYGRLASLRRNLALTGIIARGDAPHRVSLRLDGARLPQPVRMPFGTIREGQADGVVEVTFGQRGGPPEASGWFRVRDGVFKVPALPRPLTGVGLGITLDSTMWTLDSLRGSYGGMKVSAEGRWDLAGRQPSSVAVEATNVDPGRLLPDLPRRVRDNLTGSGRLYLSLERVGQDEPTRLTIAGDGLSILGRPLTEFSGEGRIEGRRVVLDSLTVRTTVAALDARGSVTLTDSVPEYACTFEGRADSLPTVPWFKGRVSVDGSIRGHGVTPEFDLSVTARDPKVDDIPVPTTTIVASYSGNKLTFATKYVEHAAVVVRGTVMNPFAADARIDCSAHVGAEPIKAFLEHVSPVAEPVSGSLGIEARIGGVLPQWRAEATLTLATSRVTGETELDASMERDAHVTWQLRSRDLRAGRRPFPLAASGRLYADSLLVDSAAFLGGVRVRGRVGLTKPDNVDLAIVYDSVSIADINAWLFDGGLPVDTGTISGATHIGGHRKNLVSATNLHVRGAALGDVGPFETDAVIATAGKTARVLPTVVRKGGAVVLTLDTLVFGNRPRVSGQFDRVDLAAFLGPALLEDEDIDVQGLVSGSFSTADSGLPVRLRLHSGKVSVAGVELDSVVVLGTVNGRGLSLERVSAREGRRSSLVATASVPWSFLGEVVDEGDTLRGDVRLSGDLVASLAHTANSPVGGSGEGTATASFTATSEGWHFTTFNVSIPSGVVSARPYIPDSVRSFSLSMDLGDSSRVNSEVRGYIGRRPVHFYSTHDIPQGYEPFMLGPLDFGIILVSTDKQSVSLHLPGFHQKGERVDVEFEPLAPFPDFALSGPVDRLKITGLWVIRNAQFTYPLFESHELAGDFEDPFPAVTWELDVTAGNRNVMYYWDLSTRHHNFMRFVEAYVDPESRIELRGRELDNTFKILGSLRSYKGSVYFGKVFDRRFEVGLDFAPEKEAHGDGYNNMPIIWGSAEAFSDSTRQDRIKVTLQLVDPSGGISERGRAAMIPRPRESRHDRLSSAEGDSIVNFSLHLSSDVEQVVGESEREFYREAGLQFTTIEGAGEFVGSMGEEYLHRYLLQRFEHRLARYLGLDVITFETSIASNYFREFYNREFSQISEQWDLLALSHVGITIGRYFFRDNLFVKARGELVPVDELLVPEYSVGFELQPVRYLFLDVNYGIRVGETSVESDPQLNLQLRLPLTRVRKLLNF